MPASIYPLNRYRRRVAPKYRRRRLTVLWPSQLRFPSFNVSGDILLRRDAVEKRALVRQFWLPVGLSNCVSVRLFVTFVYCVQTAERHP